ncbi:MAG: NAD(P)/FAD-dependent oxidoreductase [Vicinamibacterales bacterium]
MKTTYGRSPWIDQFPASRLPGYPQHKGHLDSAVAIIGGGLTGAATAYAFATAGIKVVLVEAGRLGQGGSGTSIGWIAGDPGVSFALLEKTYGVRHARRVFQAWRRAALDFSALVRRLNLKSYLEARSTIHLAFDREDVAALERDQKARKAAGVEASMLKPRATESEVAIAAQALRTRDGATLDPYRTTLGLAGAAVARGALCFERSPATRIVFRPKWVDITTRTGTIRADRVVVATGAPTPLVRQLQRHCWADSSFLTLTDTVPAKIRQKLGRRDSVIRDSARPEHIVRWVGEDRLLVAGATSGRVPERLRDKTILQRTGQLMYELSTMYPDISGIPPAYGWESPLARTVDGLPYIGPHRNLPRHLFAFGDSSHSVTGAYLASRILLRHYQEEADAADEVFAFTRVT